MPKTQPKPKTPPAAQVTLAAVESVLGVSVRDARIRYARLTPREQQVVTMMAAGEPNRDIAAALGISVKTLDIHRANAKRRLAARGHGRRGELGAPGATGRAGGPRGVAATGD